MSLSCWLLFVAALSLVAARSYEPQAAATPLTTHAPTRPRAHTQRQKLNSKTFRFDETVQGSSECLLSGGIRGELGGVCPSALETASIDSLSASSQSGQAQRTKASMRGHAECSWRHAILAFSANAKNRGPTSPP